MGTTVPGWSTEFTWRTLVMRSSLPVPAREPGNIEAPVATNTSSSTVVPLRWVFGPTRTASPTVSACEFRPRSRACSMTTTCEPSTTGPRSPLSTAPCSTRESAPIVTSPVTTADGAIQADESMCPMTRG